jgi:hypothetical protein
MVRSARMELSEHQAPAALNPRVRPRTPSPEQRRVRTRVDPETINDAREESEVPSGTNDAINLDPDDEGEKLLDIKLQEREATLSDYPMGGAKELARAGICRI